MDVVVVIAVVLIAGLLLLVLEMFLLPGTGLAGVCATGCFIFANVYAYLQLGGRACVVTLVITLVACLIFLWWIMRSRCVDNVALKQNIDSTLKRKELADIRVGDEGKSVTRLALIGNAQINGHITEVRSESGFVDEQTPIRVSRISDDIIYVTVINP